MKEVETSNTLRYRRFYEEKNKLGKKFNFLPNFFLFFIFLSVLH